MYSGNFFYQFRPKRINFSKVASDFIKSKSIVNRIILCFIISFLGLLFFRLYVHLFALSMTFNQGENSLSLFLRHIALHSTTENIIHQPWTIVTHIFISTSFYELIYYSFVFYIVNNIFLSFWNNWKLIIILVFSTVAGVFAFLFFLNFLSELQPTISTVFLTGPGAATFSVLFMLLICIPEQEVFKSPFIAVKYKFFVLIVLLLDIFLFWGNHALLFSHLAGAFVGFSAGFVTLLNRKNRKFKVKFNYKKSDNKDSSFQRPLSDEEYNVVKKKKQEQIDEILEKISKNGYESLTKSEKEFLFNQSKR